MKRILLSLTLAAAALAAQGQTLTGIVWYTTDSAKHYTGGYANTFGGDAYSRNLYVTENQPVGFSPLLNSQNLTTLPTRVAVNLSAPGDYSFQMYCNGDSSAAYPYWGLNLFFDGDDLNPRVAAWTQVGTTSWQSISTAGTATLDPLSMGTASGNTGALSAVLDGRSITVLSYYTWASTRYSIDRVADFSDTNGNGNGVKDQVIEFTVRVASVPEPASLAGLAALTIGFVSRRRLRRARS